MISRYCNFGNNRVAHSACIYITSGNNERLFHLISFFNNASKNFGIFSLDNSANYNVRNCLFQNNFNYLFYVYSGFIYLENCIINHLLNSISYGNVNQITNNSILYSNTIFENIRNNYFSTIHCDTEVPKFYINSLNKIKNSYFNLMLYFIINL